MKKHDLPHLDEQISALRQHKDSEIDFSDVPEILDCSGAFRGKFYRPIKRHVTLRLDSDVLEWFKRNHPKYQTAINSALREYVQNQVR